MTFVSLWRIGKSKIQGRGLFATKPIDKGARIIEYIGELIGSKEGDLRNQNGNPFIFYINKKFDLDGSSESNPARLLNHSCDPNCESIQVGRKIFIEAIRSIQLGEELTFDYCYYEEDEEPCHCGSPNCKGTMNSET